MSEVLASSAEEDDTLIICDVGDRAAWKGNAENPFRKEFKLKSIPTLQLKGTPKVLVEEDCADRGKLALFFED